MANKLTLELLADVNPLLKGLQQAQKSVDKFVQAAGGAGTAIGGPLNQSLSAFTSIADGGAGAAGVLAGAILAVSAGAVMAVKDAGIYAEMLDHVSQETGIATSALQNWTVTLARSGLSIDSLTTLSKKLSQTMIDAKNPNSQAARTFAELGITATTTNGVLEQLADRFRMMPDGAGKTALAVELLGKSGQSLIPVLNKGSEGFRESMLRARELGSVLSGEALAALNQSDTAFDDLGVATSAVAHQFGAVMAPAVGKVVTAMATGMGTVANFFGTIAGGGKAVENILPLMEKFNTALRAMGAPGFDAEALKKGLKQQADMEAAASQFNADRVAAEEAEKQRQVDMGEAIVKRAKLAWLAQQKVNQAFGERIELEEQIRVLQQDFHPPPTSGPQIDFLKQREAAIENLMRLMPELTREEAKLLAIHNTDAAAKSVREATKAWEDRNNVMDAAVAAAQAADAAQQTLFTSEKGMLGASDAARRVRLTLIDAEAARARAHINETIFDETRKAEALQNLDLQTDTKRRQTIQAFPSFFEQQMQAIVASNVFSMGSMVSTWTSGIAQMVVHGGNLKAVWEQTQVAIVQAALNAGVQQLALAASAASVRLGLATATAASEEAINAAKNSAIIAGDTVAATTVTAVWAGATTAIIGFFGTVTAAFSTMFASLVAVVTAVGTWIMGVLSSIAAALSATVFGIPFAGAILLGIGLIAAALALSGNLGFKEGGIGDFGSGTPATLHGPEAIIPLNSRGAAFMREAMGSREGKQIIHTHVFLHGREIAEAVSDDMPSAWRRAGLPA